MEFYPFFGLKLPWWIIETWKKHGFLQNSLYNIILFSFHSLILEMGIPKNDDKKSVALKFLSTKRNPDLLENLNHKTSKIAFLETEGL